MKTTQPRTSKFGVIDEHIRDSGLPADFWDWTWDGMTAGPHVEFARRWAGGDERGLLLEGPVGVGKTGVAAVAAVAFMRQRRLRWVHVPTVQLALGASFGGRVRERAVETLLGTKALVLDDLDKIRPRDETIAQALLMAIDQRITAGTSLLVTTNQDLPALMDLFGSPWGEPIASRLAGYCQRLVIDGPDRRMPS